MQRPQIIDRFRMTYSSGTPIIDRGLSRSRLPRQLPFSMDRFRFSMPCFALLVLVCWLVDSVLFTRSCHDDDDDLYLVSLARPPPHPFPIVFSCANLVLTARRLVFFSLRYKRVKPPCNIEYDASRTLLARLKKVEGHAHVRYSAPVWASPCSVPCTCKEFCK